MQREQYTQSDLSRVTGVSQSQISLYISGATQPSGESIAAMAEALNCTSDYLLGLSDSTRPMPSLSDYESQLLEAYRGRNLQRAMEILVNAK
jgi:transcriptional regulator with XRE-family HTH domain